MNAINREMENLKVAFDVLDDRSKISVCYNKASGYFLFDVCMKLERKYLWVKDAYETPDLEWFNISGVISIESVHVALTHATLNDVPTCACDIYNACL